MDGKVGCRHWERSVLGPALTQYLVGGSEGMYYSSRGFRENKRNTRFVEGLHILL